MQKKRPKNHRRTIKITLITLAILFGALIAFDLTPLGGTMRYYSTWMNCGQKPVVIEGSGFFNTGVSHYSTPSDINIFPAKSTYFCTAFDAEKHGYSADSHSYDFPVLRQNNALCKKASDPEPETAAIFLPCKE